MSEDILPAPILDDGSLRGRVASRRAELRDQRPFDLEVPGYEGILVARYHALDYRIVRQIGLRQEKNPNRADAEINVAADTLVHACNGLFEVMPDGSLRDTGYVWSVQAARDLFGISEAELPNGSTDRLALMYMIPNSTNLVLHYGAYSDRTRGIEDEANQTLAGESAAA